MSTREPPTSGQQPLVEKAAELQQLRYQLVTAVLSPGCAFSSIPTISEIRNKGSTLKQKAADSA
ncbi:MAG TPA: hypothetical protein VHY37_09875 [Tepidisphaeraceae bacterium]|jgi:hypothetical protein|nr:hypothetical protein [Tepidisphaeraceae bacterium]